MNLRNRATLLSLSASLLLSVIPALAHDDGLTCHSHPSDMPPTVELSFNFTEIEGPQGTGKTLAASLLGHALDNRVAADPDRYAHRDVVAVHAAIGEFEEMAGAVRRLVTRAERMADNAEFDHALRIAADTLERLPLGKFLHVDDFRAEQRYFHSVVVPFETLLEYLRDEGTPDELLSAVENSAAGC